MHEWNLTSRLNSNYKVGIPQTLIGHKNHMQIHLKQAVSSTVYVYANPGMGVFNCQPTSINDSKRFHVFTLFCVKAQALG